MEEGLYDLPLLSAGVDFVAVALDLRLDEFPAFEPCFLLERLDRLPLILGTRAANDVAVPARADVKSTR